MIDRNLCKSNELQRRRNTLLEAAASQTIAFGETLDMIPATTLLLFLMLSANVQVKSVAAMGESHGTTMN